MEKQEKQPVCFLFNSRMLIPWSVVEKGRKEGDVLEAMLLWQEANMPGHYYAPEDKVAHVDNPDLMMRVRKIIREKPRDVDAGDAKKNGGRVIGIECYWWTDVTMDNLMNMLKMQSANQRIVPGITVEQKQQ